MERQTPDLKAIFSEALERSPGHDRIAYLDQACGNDPEVRSQVERLLAAHERAEGFLESAAGAGAVATAQGGDALDAVSSPVVPPPLEGTGGRIGPYKLLQEIGEGGMGTVFMAEQEGPVRRRVALKVIKPGMDTAQVVARFEAERQALAMMDHPNIAKVFDAGTTECGRPFFVMELVKGVPITEYCDQGRLNPRNGSSSSSRSARRSSTRTRRGSSTATSSRPTCW